jgi:hypothetical protein
MVTSRLALAVGRELGLSDPGRAGRNTGVGVHLGMVGTF